MPHIFSGDDENEPTPVHENPQENGGVEAGDYTPPADTPVPGETEGIDNSQL